MKPIEILGGVQNTFLFSIFLPNIPPVLSGIGIGIPLTFQAKATSIPEKSRGSTLVHTQSGRFVLPNKSKWDHTWSVQVRLHQEDIIYRFIAEWYKKIDQVSMDQIKTKAFVQLLTNAMVPTKQFEFQGIYPMNIPGIEGLDYDNTEGYVIFTINFSYDDLIYDSIPFKFW